MRCEGGEAGKRVPRVQGNEAVRVARGKAGTGGKRVFLSLFLPFSILDSAIHSMASSSSRQHPHLPVHAASSPQPVLPIEPSDSRHQAYTMSQNLGGRRGSTDPILHAHMAATATANANNSSASPAHQQQHGNQHHQAPSPFAANSPGSRKRDAASAMLDHAGANSSPGQANNDGASNSGNGGDSDSHAVMQHMGHDGEGRASLANLSEYDLENWDGAAVAAAAAVANASANANNGASASSPGQTDQYGNYYTQTAAGGHDATNAAAPGASAGGSNATTTSTRSSKRVNRGASANAGNTTAESANNGGSSTETKSSLPYARSPELRVSHKLAERKRRKEMKDLFDGLKKCLPDPETVAANTAEAVAGSSSRAGAEGGPSTESAKDRGKLSKWEVLSRASNHITWLQQCKDKLLSDVERLRQQVGLPPFELPPYPQAEAVNIDDESKDADATMGEGEAETEAASEYKQEHQEHHSEHEQHEQHQIPEPPQHSSMTEANRPAEEPMSAVHHENTNAGHEIQAAMNMFKAQQQQQQQQAQ
ncbi:hypothetical protein BDZ90DRAFT_233084 [Jaminaea rosea]|uniref:BHLH domain-containing protein n=1 Tax=Jaminaea rosea TaxID=1569628 RepID=A0A316UQ58_9BASI|nr:hypothetical protein BDZ90DRAFT_233084 [Jaminaea rosea]PWN26441.1 hypothetical protein BDZ90DRAFT_233084 [Jaminaea rosea]